MGVREFERITGWLCLDFTNTVHQYGAKDPGDDLRDFKDFAEWAVQSSILKSSSSAAFRKTIHHSQAAAYLNKARRMRKDLYRIFSAIAGGSIPPADAMDGLNKLLKEGLPHRHLLAGKDGIFWVWEELRSDPRILFWKIAHSASQLLTSSELVRLRECNGPTCTWLFVDYSKNQSRRWCDMKNCGNREKSRRHYARIRKTR